MKTGFESLCSQLRLDISANRGIGANHQHLGAGAGELPAHSFADSRSTTSDKCNPIGKKHWFQTFHISPQFSG
jgi:hypothetical protein